MREVYSSTFYHIAKSYSSKGSPNEIISIMSDLYNEVDRSISGVHGELKDIRERGFAEAKVDCKEGCNFCCHMEVTVMAPELIIIKNFVDSRFSVSEKTNLLERIQSRNKESSQMTDEEKAMGSRPCPFLVSGKCSIYLVRPFTCRAHHSADVTACKFEFEGRNTTVPLIQEFSMAVAPIMSASVNFFKSRNLQLEPLWLSQAAEIALLQDESIQNWIDGRNPFEPASKLDYELKLASKGPPKLNKTLG